MIRKLPFNWSLADLRNVCVLINGDRGKNYPSRDKLSKEGIPFVNAGFLQNNRIVDVKMNYIDEDRYNLLNSGKFIINDILFCIRGSLGKVALNTTFEKGAIASSLIIVRPEKGLDPKYTLYFLSSPLTKEMINRFDNGTAQPNLSGADFGRFEFPIAPLPEQHRIVAKLEELFSELDKGIEYLRTARAQLKVYRQAVLKHAFEGKLTAEWRQANANQLASAEELLASIKKERAAHQQQQLNEWQTAVTEWEANGKPGKKPTKPPPPKELPPLSEAELAELPVLPDGWMWAYPEEICSNENYSIGIGPFGSNLKVSDYKESGIPLIFVRNITRNDFSLNQHFISEKKYQELIPHSVKPEDILVAKMGDPPGDCTIYPQGSAVAVLTADCLKFRIQENHIKRKYINYCIKSVFIKKQLGLITKGVAQKKISAARFKTLKFPITSKIEQSQIVAEIESRLSVCDKLEETIETSLQQAESLRQSILKKAFEGKLVPQDPNDEPAEALLKRIKDSKTDYRSTKNGQRKA